MIGAPGGTMRELSRRSRLTLAHLADKARPGRYQEILLASPPEPLAQPRSYRRNRLKRGAMPAH